MSRLAMLGRTLDPSEFFIVPHHTTRTGKHGEIPDELYPGLDWMPVAEIHSKWGASEYRGNPYPLKRIHPGPSYVVDLLNQGLPLGFIAGTDTHTTMPSGFGVAPAAGNLHVPPGFTAIRAPSLSRGAIFESILDRRCYATSLERICLDVTVAGLRPGVTSPWAGGESREIHVTVAAASDIEKVEIVRNGQTLLAQPGDGWHMAFDVADDEPLDGAALEAERPGRFVYYYVRVTCVSGAQAWSSPVWLTG